MPLQVSPFCCLTERIFRAQTFCCATVSPPLAPARANRRKHLRKKEREMAAKADVRDAAVLSPRPECDPGRVHEGCDGPPPTPWLSWKHCFKIYEFREMRMIHLDQTAAVIRARGIKIVCGSSMRCVRWAASGAIVHSLSLLPQEEVNLRVRPVYPRHQRRPASASAPLSHYVSKVTESLASVKLTLDRLFQHGLGCRVFRRRARSRHHQLRRRVRHPLRFPSAVTSTSIRSSNRSPCG